MEEIIKSKIDEKYYFEKLKNGLSVYLLPNKNVKSFYITFATHFGSLVTEFKGKKEKKWYKVPNGIAHFLEHQMFAEDKGKSAYEYFSNLGSNANAFTNYNVTAYEVYGNENFKENLECLINYVQNPYFTAEGVKKEKGIISEEIKMYEGNPSAEIQLGMNKLLFIKDNHQFTISGTISDIEKITDKDLKLCYDYFYHPENMFVIITGNFNHYEALSIIKENQSNKTFPIYKDPITKKYTEPNNVAIKNFTKEMNVEIPKVNISYKINKKIFSFLKLSELELKVYLELILNAKFGITSNFNQHLISSELISVPLAINCFPVKDHIILGIVVASKYTEEIIEQITKEMMNLSITKDEFSRKIRVGISDYISMFDSIESVNLDLQDDILRHKKPIDNYLDIIDNLDYEICKKILETIILDDYSIYKVVPFKEKES